MRGGELNFLVLGHSEEGPTPSLHSLSVDYELYSVKHLKLLID